MTIAALTATLALYRDPVRAIQEIPALAMIAAPAHALEQRAIVLALHLAQRGIAAELVATEATVGGGAFPTARLASWALALGGDPEVTEGCLRAGATPVIGRVADGRLLIELRSVPAAQDAALEEALVETLSAHG